MGTRRSGRQTQAESVPTQKGVIVLVLHVRQGGLPVAAHEEHEEYAEHAEYTEYDETDQVGIIA